MKYDWFDLSMIAFFVIAFAIILVGGYFATRHGMQQEAWCDSHHYRSVAVHYNTVCVDRDSHMIWPEPRDAD